MPSSLLRKGKLLSCVRLFLTPWTIWSMEFSRPEHWSGYPYPSPGHLPNPGIESIWSPMEFSPGLLRCRQILYQLSHRGSPRILEWVAYPFSSGSPNPGIELGSPTLQADSLPAEPQGKPKNTGVGSLSLLQGIFPTQESNWGLLHCKQILYQLSYQGMW